MKNWIAIFLDRLKEPRFVPGVLFALLVMFLPNGTRWILYAGDIQGHAVEPGTVSVFGMQLVALAFVLLVFLRAGWQALADVARRPPGMFAALVAVAALLSTFEAADPLAALTQASFVATGVALFFAIQIFKPDPHEVLGSFVGGALFQFPFGAWQFMTQDSFASKWLGMALHRADQLGSFVVETGTGRWLRAYGTLSHPNVFGLYVGIGLLMCVGLAAFRGHGRHLWHYAAMPAIAAALLFSFSRSAMLGTAVGFVWMTVSAFASPAAPHLRRVLVPALLAIGITAVTLGFLYAEPLLVRAQAQGRLEEQSVTQRVSQFQDALELFSRHVVQGVGIGEMPLVLAREGGTSRPWWLYDSVHNVPALVAVETGVIGLFVWLGFVLSVFDVMRRRLLHAAMSGSGVTTYAACFLAMIVAAQFDHFLWSSWFGQSLFWIVAGILHEAYEGLGHEGHPGR
jgi:O-antigen ligase